MNLSTKAKKVFSQNGEDGAIEYIFEKIGIKHRIFVEFGFGCYENNSRNLFENHGFSGLFIDGDLGQCQAAVKYYGTNVSVENAFITKHNINELISKHYTGDIDFLSIDVDGVDVYLLDTINVVKPRVVCIEYCASIGPDKSVTVIYKDDFNRHTEHQSGFYCNASLKANINVMKKKGYKFIGTINGLNAFFIHNNESMDEITLDEGFEPHYARTYEGHLRHDGTVRKMTQQEQIDTIKDLKWVEVDEKGIIKE